ncbi:MAG: hypothetical protein ACEPOW_07545 [Bacteroidales bacterium]
MKNLKIALSLIFIFAFTFTSCKKDDEEPVKIYDHMVKKIKYSGGDMVEFHYDDMKRITKIVYDGKSVNEIMPQAIEPFKTKLEFFYKDNDKIFDAAKLYIEDMLIDSAYVYIKENDIVTEIYNKNDKKEWKKTGQVIYSRNASELITNATTSAIDDKGDLVITSLKEFEYKDLNIKKVKEDTYENGMKKDVIVHEIEHGNILNPFYDYPFVAFFIRTPDLASKFNHTKVVVKENDKKTKEVMFEVKADDHNYVKHITVIEGDSKREVEFIYTDH